MGESHSAAAAPAEAASAPAANEKSGTRAGRRLRVPTSFLVTILGITLSAWLLPAFTRQWEDARRADELKATLATEIATATANALIGLEQQLQRPYSGSDPLVISVANDWSVRSLQIESRLRSYFTPSLVATWQLYSYLVGRAVATTRQQPGVSAELALNADQDGVLISEEVAGEAHQLLGIFPILLERRSLSSPPAAAGPEEMRRDVLAELHASAILEWTGNRSDASARQMVKRIQKGDLTVLVDWRVVETRILHLQEFITSAIIESHPRGYSTTPRNLLDDLLPG